MATESHLQPLQGPATPGRFRIYVCRIAIERNRTEGADFPPITVRYPDGRGEFCRRVRIDGPSEIVYELNGLEDGTSVWVETDGPLEITT